MRKLHRVRERLQAGVHKHNARIHKAHDYAHFVYLAATLIEWNGLHLVAVAFLVGIVGVELIGGEA